MAGYYNILYVHIQGDFAYKNKNQLVTCLYEICCHVLNNNGNKA